MKPAHVIPLALFVLVGIALFVGLGLQPRNIPSALIGKPVPQVDMPPLFEGRPGITVKDLTTGGPKLVNVFASWCVPCRVEHPVLMDLEARGVPIFGLNYDDAPEAGRRFLQELDDPYTLTGSDYDTRIGLEWGVYGVPETFIITGDGVIVAKYISPLTAEQVTNEILPKLRQLGWED